MPSTPLYPLVDKALRGALRARLVEARKRGDSFDDIAIALRAEEVTVSGETVRKWCHELGIEQRAAS